MSNLPIPLIVAGALVLLGLIGVALGLGAKSSVIDIKTDNPISNRRKIILGIGIIFLAGGLIWAIAEGIKSSKSPGNIVVSVPQVKLVNISYIVGDWNPRVIDLLTVEEKGISVDPRISLRFFDLWVSVPSEAHNYFIGSEIYGDGELIGTTGFQQVDSELVKVNEILIKEKYIDPDVESGKAWEMNWKKLDLYIYLYPNDQPGQKSISTSHTVIKIQPGDSAWYIKPPYAHFVSIEYVINDGQTQTIDLRSILDIGLPLSAGDQINFSKIWYKADTDSYGHQIQVECYLTPEDYNGDRLKSTKFFTQTKGVSEIPNLTDFNWTVLDGEKYIVITLTRDDSTVLDRYVIPIIK